MSDSDLEIPESNREIALHLRAIRNDIGSMNNRLDNLENTLQERRFRKIDMFLTSLVFPLVGAVFMFLLPKVT